MKNIQAHEAPQWTRLVNKSSFYLTEDLFGGPKLIKMAWVINLHKFLTAFVVLFMMNYYGNFSKEAYIYLALHGSYEQIKVP